MKTPYDVVDTLLVTEKNTELQESGKYVFKVAPDATKIEIGKAVEALFADVKVKSVNVMNYSGKPKRVGRSMRMGRRSNWKKAVVTLSEGSIDVI
jgi:large subunit ribosomal protein L23